MLRPLPFSTPYRFCRSSRPTARCSRSIAAPRSPLGPGDNSPTNATSRSSCSALRTCSTGRSAFGARAACPRRSSVLRRSDPRRRSTTWRRSCAAPKTACRRGSVRRSVPVRRSAHNLLNDTNDASEDGRRNGPKRARPSYHETNLLSNRTIKRIANSRDNS